MSDPDESLEAGLARLAARDYAEEGIPMALILEGAPGASDAALASLGRRAGEVFAVLEAQAGQAKAADLARVIEWLADESFGPATLSRRGR